MREIKFRAWLKNAGSGIVVAELLTLKEIGLRKLRVDFYYAINQYTGLKDKNGVEIYEGDTVNCAHGNTLEVIWSEEDAAYLLNKSEPLEQAFLGQEVEDGVEVIGNIYENKDLL